MNPMSAENVLKGRNTHTQHMNTHVKNIILSAEHYEKWPQGAKTSLPTYPILISFKICPTNGKSVPTMTLLDMPGEGQDPLALR